MSTYICEKCGCIDNTACGGNYWLASMNKSRIKRGEEPEIYYKEDEGNTKYLCVECSPKEFIDGSIREKAGKWHNMFPKRHWTEYGKEKIMESYNLNVGNFVNAEEYFENLREEK